MDITLTATIILASVTIIGWLVTHTLSISAEKRRQRLVSQMEFTKQQLEELYGPLAFLILEGRQTFQDFLAAVGWSQVFEIGDPLLENELKIWLFWVENDFFPRNQKIKELLSSKTHLIEGEKVPESFLTFLDHFNSWQINHLRWKEHGIEYGWRSKITWPNKFDEDVISTFKELKKRHSILIGMLSEDKNFLFSFQGRLRGKSP